MTTELIKYNYQDIEVEFTSSAFINATQIAKKFGKKAGDFLKNTSTKDYIKALAIDLQADANILVSVIKGGDGEQGTFLHPKLGVLFARWLKPEFAIWCDKVIENLTKPKNETQPIKRSNITLLKEMVNELEIQAMRLEQVESRVIELEATVNTIEHKPALNITVSTAKAFKTLKQDKLIELGREINNLVFEKFLSEGSKDYHEAHKKAHKSYKLETGITYVGAKKASYQSKLEFLEWLKKY
jgi:hypothetical protein